MATLTITTLDDEAFGGGDLATETGDGNGLSLREALALAQDGDIIEFDGSLAGGTITLLFNPASSSPKSCKSSGGRGFGLGRFSRNEKA